MMKMMDQDKQLQEFLIFSLKMDFDNATASFSKSIHIADTVGALTNEERLEFYGLFKQGTDGDVNTERPTSFMDMKGKAKWDAWKAKEGMSQDKARAAYIAKVQDKGFMELTRT